MPIRCSVRGTRRLHVVHRDVVGRAAEHPLAEQHEREADVQQLDVFLPEPLGTEEHAVGEPQPLAREHGDLALARRAGLVDDDVELWRAAARMIESASSAK